MPIGDNRPALEAATLSAFAGSQAMSIRDRERRRAENRALRAERDRLAEVVMVEFLRLNSMTRSSTGIAEKAYSVADAMMAAARRTPAAWDIPDAKEAFTDPKFGLSDDPLAPSKKR